MGWTKVAGFGLIICSVALLFSMIEWQTDKAMSVDVPASSERRYTGPLPDEFKSALATSLECTDSCEEKKSRLESMLSSKRYMAHVSLDKETYRPGETAYIRAVLIDAATDKLATTNDYVNAKLEIKGPTGETVYEAWLQNQEKSVVSHVWKIDNDRAGGEYRAEITPQMQGSPMNWRTFIIRPYRQPKFTVVVEFTSEHDADAGGYGFGDVIHGKVKATRADGSPCASATLSWKATVDGVALQALTAPAQLDADGAAPFSFQLPSQETGEGQGSVSVSVSDGGDVEGQAKTIPMVVRSLDLRLYPEGGDLCAGLPGRVYFEALTKSGEPVALEAELWEVAAAGSPGPAGPVLALSAEHEGRGAFEFTPAPGRGYEVRPLRPAGLPPTPLPVASFGPGVSLHTGPGVFGPGLPLRVAVRALGGRGRRLRVAVARKELELSSAPAEVPEGGGPAEVVLSLPSRAAGVLRVTVWEAAAAAGGGGEVPLAERLVFREPARRLELTVRADPAAAAPGAAAAVVVEVREGGRPVPGAVVGLAVVDRRSREAVERRRRRPLLPAMALLEADVAHLEDAGAYLPEWVGGGGGGDGGGAAAGRGRRRLDLLLGTQGWRRFVYLDPLRGLPPPKPAWEGGAGKGGGGGKGAAAERRRLERVLGAREPDLALGGPMVMNMAMAAMPGPARFAVPMAAMAGLERAEAMEEESDEGDAEGDAEGLAPPGFPGPVGAPGAHGMAKGLDAARVVDSPVGLAELVAGGAEGVGGGAAPEGPAAAAAEDWAAAGGDDDDGAVPAAGAQDGLADGGGGDDALEVDLTPQALGKVMGKVARPAFMPGLAPPLPPWSGAGAVRVYARAPRPRGQPRADPSETVLWAAGEAANASGAVRLEFALGDAPASYVVVAEAHAGGEPGEAFGAWEGDAVAARLSVQVDIKLPSSAVVGDLVNAPVTVASGADAAMRLDVLSLDPAGGLSWAAGPSGGQAGGEGFLSRWPLGAKLAAGSRVRRDAPLEVTGVAGTLSAKVRGVAAGAEGAPEEDGVVKALAAAPRGFPMSEARSGTLRAAAGGGGGAQPDGEAKAAATARRAAASAAAGSSWEWEVPAGAMGAQVAVKVMTSPIATLTAALEALLQEPCGCFEQTSSTTYPTVMALTYFLSRPDTPPALVQKAVALVEKGYKRLASFEVKETGGFEWFGAAPAHEALTSYGLALFLDMRKVWQPADGMEAMLDRTRAFLHQRRDDPGATFHFSTQHLDQFGGAPANVARAYVLWSLSAEPGEADGLDAQVAALHTEASTSEDAYVIALAAGTLFNLRRSTDALGHAKRLMGFQEADGRVSRGKTSITSSLGDALLVETTSLAVLAWLKAGSGMESAARAGVEWLATKNSGGRFGSTQATVLSLKAIIAYETVLGSGERPDEVTLLVDGVAFASKPPPAGLGAMLTFDDVPIAATPGKHKLELVARGGNAALPYTASLTYRADLPPACPGRRLSLETRVGSGGEDPVEVGEGETVEIIVKVARVEVGEEGEGGAVVADRPALGMTVAIVGLPGGLEPRFDRLAELRREGQIDWFELRGGNEVVLYWRYLKEGKEVRLEAIGGVPGHYTGRASRAYEYYFDECKAWTDLPLSAHVVAAAQNGA